MTRRARIVLLSALALVLVAGAVVASLVATAATQWGRDRVRDLAVALLTPRVRGSLYLGRITSGLYGSVTIDSLAIRGRDDSLFLASGPVTVHYDLRDLLDRRYLLRNVRLEHPIVHLRQRADGTWNFQDIFPSSPPSPLSGGGPSPFIVLDSAVVHDASFLLTLPWHVSPAFRGAVRDSVIRAELARRDQDVRRTRDGFVRTWRWTHGDLVVRRGRVSDPDSAGMRFDIADARVQEADPPFRFRNVRGTVRQLGDSVWVQVPHFDLPGSTGRAAGRVTWGSNQPVRYDIQVIGDSVSLADVAWVYPTLPRTGGGRTHLAIRSERDARFTDFALTHLDVRSERSHLTGGMTFVIGHDTLVVKDVQLAADPVNFDLLRTLNGKPFPYNWQGDLRGTVRGAGGSLGRFRIDDARVTFADANVPGAISRASGHGELDIFQPAYTAFHDFTVDVGSLDLRTLQFLNPTFPRLAGTVAGRAVLDSSWMDLRFHDAQLTHQDGPGPVSHVSGSGRVTWGAQYLTYDLSLDAAPLAFATIRRSYQGMPLRASMSGPIRVVGQSPALQVDAVLATGPDTLSWHGQVDADPPTFGAHGTGSVAHADLPVLLDMPSVPATSLTGTFALDVSGDSLADFVGTATADLLASRVGRVAVAPSFARLRFDRGVVRVDTLSLHAAGARADAAGTVALAPAVPGALRYAIAVPTLSTLGDLFGAGAMRQRLAGSAEAAGTLRGTPDALDVAGTFAAHRLAYGAVAAASAVQGTYELRDVTRAPTGSATVVVDSATAGAVPVPHAALALSVAVPGRLGFRADLRGAGATRGTAAGVVTRDSVRTDVRLDTLGLTVDSLNRYFLATPAELVATSAGVALDSLILQRAAGGAVALRDVRLAGDSVRASLRTRGFSLAFLELFGSTVTELRGALAADVDLAGTLHRPRLTGQVTVQDGSATIAPAGVHIARLDADIRLTGDTVRVRRLAATTSGARRGTLDVTGTVALDSITRPRFALQAVARGFRAVDRRGLATLDVSTTAPLTLTGPYDCATVTGGILVDRGTVYIPEVVRKRVVDLTNPALYDVVDSTMATDRAILPQSPSPLLRDLHLENVAIRVGDDVWLRSAEANIKLGGSLNVSLDHGSRAQAPGTSQLVLQGELLAERGTYRLNVVPFVQPTFDVERGTLRFYGTRELDPALDITALATVHQPTQSLTGQDVRIRATIGGTLTQPTLTLASADNLPLSQSDLLSYLITGEPSFALDSPTQQYLNQLAAAAVRSAGSLISSAIPRSVFDVVELQTPGVVTSLQTGSPAIYNNLLNTRAVVGKQLNNSLFLNLSTGFCAPNFRRNIGIQLEYRFARTYSAQLGIEPGSADLACARSGAAQAIQSTPPQFGIDVLRSWRF